MTKTNLHVSLFLSLLILGIFTLPLSDAYAKYIVGEFKGEKNQVLTIMQNEWALISASDSRLKYLSSNDATSCVMVLWRLSDRSALAHSHFDVATDVEKSVDEIILEMRKTSSSEISVVISGESSDAGLSEEIQNALKSRGVRIELIFNFRNLAGSLNDELYNSPVYSETLGPIESRWKSVQLDTDSVQPKFQKFFARHGRYPTRTELNRTLIRVGK